MTKNYLHFDYITLKYDFNGGWLDYIKSNLKTRPIYDFEGLDWGNDRQPIYEVVGGGWFFWESKFYSQNTPRRTYIKIDNKILYKKPEVLFGVLEDIKKWTEGWITPLQIHRLDVAIDIIDNSKLSEYLTDYHNQNKLLTTDPKITPTYINQNGLRTLYFNTHKNPKEKTESCRLYDKSELLKTTPHKLKGLYQNPEDLYLERLEVSLTNKSKSKTKTFNILSGLMDYIMSDTKDFVWRQNVIIQYIFKEFEFLYLSELFTYNDLFEEDFDDFDEQQITKIKELVELSKQKINQQQNLYKINTKIKTKSFDKVRYKKDIITFIDLFWGDLDLLTPKIIDKIITQSGLTKMEDIKDIKIFKKETGWVEEFKSFNKLVYDRLSDLSGEYKSTTTTFDFDKDLYDLF